MTDKNRYPAGWDAVRVRRVLEHYESQSEDETLAEDEARFERPEATMMEIPRELVPAVRDLITKHTAK